MKVEITINPFQINRMGSYRSLIKKIYNILDLEEKKEIKVINFPFCLLPNAKDHIIFDKKFHGIKEKKCKKCRYDNKCLGLDKKLNDLWGGKILNPIKDLPDEIMIEVESRCNLRCNFCYNKNSFAGNGREGNLESGYVKKIIDAIYSSGIKIVRFTGGEPLLRKDIFNLMRYAKRKGLEVRLNTNALLINEGNAKNIARFVDNVLISLEAVNSGGEAAITGDQKSFSKKIKAIKLLKKYKIKIVRIGTVATKENIKNLEKFFRLIVDLGVDEWEVYRPIPILGEKNIWSKSDVKAITEKLIKFRKISGKTFFIANGVPFCAYDRNKVNSVSSGALPEDGHIRFTIDPRGFAKPHYYFNKKIGNPLDIMSCWNSDFMKKMRNLEFVPNLCKGCFFLEKCRGGSRYIANMASGSYKAKDPLQKNEK